MSDAPATNAAADSGHDPAEVESNPVPLQRAARVTVEAPRKKVLVTGACGYVGRHTCGALYDAGYDIRALVRAGSKRGVIEDCCEDFFEGDVTDAASLEGACDGIRAVIHLVGVINEKEGSFEKIHVEGTRNLIAEAKRAGVPRFIYLSGLGTRPDAKSQYHQTKYAAEQSVLHSGMEGYCFPASVIFGPEDEFLNLFVGMARSSFNPPWPIMPAIGGGHNYLQPIWVEDVAECLARAVSSKFPFAPGTYELGGPEPLTIRQILRYACKAAGVSRVIVPVPMWKAHILAWLMETFSDKPQLTRDQLIMLREDGRAKNNMTEKILEHPARTMWTYVQSQFGMDRTYVPVVGESSYNNRTRPQAGINWQPAPPKEEAGDKKAPAKK